MQVAWGADSRHSTNAISERFVSPPRSLGLTPKRAPIKESTMRVLVIEDDPDVNHVVASFLREEGYSVDTAKDGEEGLYKATAWNYDAVLLDVMLPKLDGWKVLTELRRAKKTPVLMLTARDAVPDRVRGLNSGYHYNAIKPWRVMADGSVTHV